MAEAFNRTASIGGLVPCQAGPGLATFAIDATNDVLEFLFQAERADTLTHALLSVSAIGTSATLTVELCNVSNGRAGGTVHASGTFTPATGINAVAFSSSYAVTIGQKLAIKVTCTSGPVNVTFNTRMSNLGAESFWHAVTVNAGGAAAHAIGLCTFGYKSASRCYGWPVRAIDFADFSSDSTPDEKALRFTEPSGHGDTYQIAGVRALIRTPAAAKTIRITLYDTDNSTVLQQVDVDTDDLHTAAVSGFYLTALFDEAVDLDYGSTYNLSFAPQETSTALRLCLLQLPASAGSPAENTALMGGNWGYSSRTNGGSWTHDSTQVPVAELLIKDVTEPAAGGGGGGPLVSAAPFVL